MAFRNAVATVLAGTSGNANLPTLAAGDYLGALITTDDFTKDPTLTGFTERADCSISAPDGQSARYYDKIATGSEGASVAVSGLATGDTTIIIGSWSGRDGTNRGTRVPDRAEQFEPGLHQPFPPL